MAALKDRGDTAIKLFGRTIPLRDASAEVSEHCAKAPASVFSNLSFSAG
jgi:hypothetical protein